MTSETKVITSQTKMGFVCSSSNKRDKYYLIDIAFEFYRGSSKRFASSDGILCVYRIGEEERRRMKVGDYTMDGDFVAKHANIVGSFEHPPFIQKFIFKAVESTTLFLKVV